MRKTFFFFSTRPSSSQISPRVHASKRHARARPTFSTSGPDNVGLVTSAAAAAADAAHGKRDTCAQDRRQQTGRRRAQPLYTSWSPAHFFSFYHGIFTERQKIFPRNDHMTYWLDYPVEHLDTRCVKFNQMRLYYPTSPGRDISCILIFLFNP